MTPDHRRRQKPIELSRIAHESEIIAPGHIGLSISAPEAKPVCDGMLKRANFFEGEVEAIDLPRKQVIVSHGYDHHQHSLTYDHLVIGIGSVTNLYELPGLDERTLTMKSRGYAIRLRNHLIEHLEESDSECVTGKNPLLTFVVAGGRFAGT